MEKITCNNSVVIQRADFVSEIRDLLLKQHIKFEITMSYVLSVSLPEVSSFQIIITLIRYTYTASSTLTVDNPSADGYRTHFYRRSRKQTVIRQSIVAYIRRLYHVYYCLIPEYTAIFCD